MIALFAPGQGSQTPGMLNPWLELPGVAEQVVLSGQDFPLRAPLGAN